MIEIEFVKKYNETLFSIEECIEGAITNEDVDLDYETVNDILTITCKDDSSIIITKQSALHELWLAAKSGGFHFKYQDKQWHCTTKDKYLTAMLSEIIDQQGDVAINFPPL